MVPQCDSIIELVSEHTARYHLSSLEPLLASCRAACAQDAINIAVMGRFKAGKSSFLNHLLGRNLLPVGVVPVTAVITEIGYGAREKATVYYLDGHSEEVTLDVVRGYIAESENPENIKGVSKLLIELPELEQFQSLRFVDTPGLESALAHNTEETTRWLPNVGLALDAVSIDTPLSEHDLALLKGLRRYTPNISILLTKADLLSEDERAEVISYIRGQLARAFDSAINVFPYSVRPGYERFKAQLEEELIGSTLADFRERHNQILKRKLETLLSECRDYLTLALKSAVAVESERDALRRQVVGEKEALDETKAELRLIVRHAAGGTREQVARRLGSHRSSIEAHLSETLRAEFPNWAKSLNRALGSYERWLHRSLMEEMGVVSNKERARLVESLQKAERQVFRALQSFRDRLSERTMRAYGVPLRTSETEIRVEEPRTPDIRVGKVFDRNWEMLSAVTPMWLVRGLVERHFTGKLPYMVEKNLSRLASQWAESINAAIAQAGREAERRLDELISTVERLVVSSADIAPQIRRDLEGIDDAGAELSSFDAQGAAR